MDHESPSENQKRGNGILKFLGNPIVGIVIGILITAGFFYWVERKEVEPTYAITVPELLASQTNDAPNLKLYWDDEEIEDIFSVKIVFWNAGREYLDKDSISDTDPLRIQVPSGINILYAEFIQTSRDNLVLSTTIKQLDNDTTEIIIDIVGDEALERKDGGILKILFTGAMEEDEFQVIGRIKGSSGIKQQEWPNSMIFGNSWFEIFETVSSFVFVTLSLYFMSLTYRNRRSMSFVRLSITTKIIFGMYALMMISVTILLIINVVYKNSLYALSWIK